jgi:chaperonin cofactor prefoldin
MNPDTGTLGIPWNNFLTFAAARAATINSLTSNVTTIQGQITVIQGQISTLQGQVGANTTAITTLQGQVSTLQSQVSTIQGQITALQNEDTNLQNQINTIDQIFSVFTVSALPAPSAGRKTNVSDAAAPTFGVAVAGGGAIFTPVYSDGTTWFVG